MKKSKGYIGVFDSGFGGLAVLKEITKALPAYSYVYLGDTARAPYGIRSSEAVDRFTFEAIDFLFEKGCELVVIACNTASAEALRQVQKQYLPKHYPSRRVLGVIVPAAEEAVRKTQNRRIGVLATPVTVASGSFTRELQSLDPKMRVFEQAAPLLVPLVEEGRHRSQATHVLLKEYLAPLLKRRIDTLILGCTHYEHLKAEIAKIVGKKVHVIYEGRVVANGLTAYLKRHPEIDAKLRRKSAITFYTTDTGKRFKTLGSEFFGRRISPRKAEIG